MPIKLRHIGKPKDDDPNRAFFKDQQTATVGGKRQEKASAGRVGKYNASGEAKPKAANRAGTKAATKRTQKVGGAKPAGSGKKGPARKGGKTGGFKVRGTSDQQRKKRHG